MSCLSHYSHCGGLLPSAADDGTLAHELLNFAIRQARSSGRTVAEELEDIADSAIELLEINARLHESMARFPGPYPLWLPAKGAES